MFTTFKKYDHKIINVNMRQGAGTRRMYTLCGGNVDTMNGPDGNRVGNYGKYISRQKA